jgi:hypothetical protein
VSEAFNVDIPDTAFDAPAEAPEAVETPAPVEAPAAEAPAPVETPDADVPAGETEARTFDESYVKELRQESANYRTQAKPFKEAFDGVDDADRDIFLGLVQAYKSDPVAAAKEMARLAQGLLGDEPETPAADAPAADPQYMTRADYDAMKRQESVEAAAAQIERDAKAMGYERGTPEYAYLLSAAQSKGGDLQAAHSYIQERQQAAIQQFVAAKTADAQNAPVAPADASAPPTGERSLKSWRDVENAIDELF